MDPPTARPRIRGIVMFGALLASYAINAMDRQLFPLLVPEVRRQYGFSLAGVGFLSTVFTLGMALAGLPTGYLLVRFSRKTVMQVGIALFSTGTLLTIVARGFSDMLIYRAATGIGEAMQLTVLIAIAVNYFVHHRSTALGAINFTFGLGAIVSPILERSALTAYRSWQAPMAVFGLLGFLALAVIAVVVDPWFTETQTVSYERENRGGGRDACQQKYYAFDGDEPDWRPGHIRLPRNVPDIPPRRSALFANDRGNCDEFLWTGGAGFDCRRMARRSLLAKARAELHLLLYRRAWLLAFPWIGSLRFPSHSVIPLGPDCERSDLR